MIQTLRLATVTRMRLADNAGKSPVMPRLERISPIACPTAAPNPQRRPGTDARRCVSSSAGCRSNTTHPTPMTVMKMASNSVVFSVSPRKSHARRTLMTGTVAINTIARRGPISV